MALKILIINMGLLRIMSVGRSGVGKSTIGNMILYGNAKGSFETSTASKSCTQDSKVLMEDKYVYIDVPGIPDTDPNNTAKFYNIIINEAKKELTVIFFVFKKERIDHAAYRLAEMLFRELNKSNALKVLIINDHNSYAFDEQPTKDEYDEQAHTIVRLTKLDFAHRINFTSITMRKELESLMETLSYTKSHISSHLQSFNELSDYVDLLQHKKNYEEEIIRLEEERISRLQWQLTGYQALAAGASTAATAATLSSIFTFGATIAVGVSTGMAALAAGATMEIKKAELQAAKERINKENLARAAKELQEACINFEQLKAALQVI